MVRRGLIITVLWLVGLAGGGQQRIFTYAITAHASGEQSTTSTTSSSSSSSTGIRDHPQIHGTRQLKKKTCLLVSIDNRELTETVNDGNYAPKTAVLNLEYANYHGYDFLYVQNIVKDFEAMTRARFKNINDKIPKMDAAKDVATAYHVGLQQFRAASWAKLPALWHVTTTVGTFLREAIAYHTNNFSLAVTSL